MGCGSSIEAERSSLDSFFPPEKAPRATTADNKASEVTRTKTRSSAPQSSTRGSQEHTVSSKKQVVHKKSPQTSTEKRKSKTKKTPVSSPTKTPVPKSPTKKTAYIPPSPITSVAKKTKAKTVRKKKAKKMGKSGDDDSFNEDLLSPGQDKVKEAGILSTPDDFNSSRIDESVISQMSGEMAEAAKAIPEQEELDDDDYSEAGSVRPEPGSDSGMRFDELYTLKGVLGTGAFSTVREGFHSKNKRVGYAVKCINRKKLTEEDEAALLDEVAILKEMDHIHIIRLYDFFTEPNTYYLVMERMRGGELFDRIVAKAYYNEKEARDTCKIVLEAVGHCHKNNVAHRDLKPENLLLLSENDDSAVKIADFGFAKKVYKHNTLTTQCGTPGYVAPEILEGTPYDERADMWSVGVILYILLGGYPPFIESTQRDLFRKIRKGDYEFHEEYWGTVSSDAKDLISQLLTVDCKKRLNAYQALENDWILGDDKKLASKDLGPNLKKLANFNAKRKLRAAVSVVIAMNKLNFLSESFVKPPE